MSKGDLVWLSEAGRVCPRCEKPVKSCVCQKEGVERPRGDGVARIRREVKGRRGKTVTTVSGLALSDSELRDLARELKQRCGCGGSVSDGVILIQGDARDAIRKHLESRGFTVKLAGG